MEIPVDDGIVLYTYWRSSAAYRVRIALELKGLAWDARPVHLVREGGEQHLDAYRALNPQQLVPTLLHDGHTLTQSLAIVEYLDERFPQVPLLPADAAGRARVRALAQLVACDIHPINNLRVWLPWKRCWPAVATPAPSATATARAWPTSACCRSCTTPTASAWT
ncbi:hypothetical protein G6F62_013735 [Rhizopus arrhizus]|nr:hypothetical protein G6F62_013735 [Rhizopus arrhizus]